MALVRPHEEPLRWRVPAAIQMIRNSMKALQTMACAIAFAVPHVVASQASPPASHPAVTTASQLTYESAFDDYRPYEEVPVADWRGVNDTVRDAAIKGGSHASQGIPDTNGSGGSAVGKEAASPPAPAQQRTGQEMVGSQGMKGRQQMHEGHR